MKNFNLYPQLTGEKKDVLRNWLYFSAGLFLIIVITITTIDLPPLIKLYRAKKSQKNFFIVSNQLQHLETELKEKREEHSKIKKLARKYTSVAHNPDFYMSLLSQLLPDDVALRSITGTQHEPVVIHGVAYSHQALDTFLQNLKTSNKFVITELERTHKKTEKLFFKISLILDCKNMQ